MPDSVLTFIAIGLAFILAGFVKGVIGMGLPTIVVGLLSLIMPPSGAVALMLIPSLLTNVWQGAAGPYLAEVMRRLWPVLIGICIGAWAAGRLGIWLLTPEAAHTARRALGLTLMVYALFGLTNFRFTLQGIVARWLGPAVGVATGLVSAATGVFMFPAVPYYQSIGMNRELLVQAQGVSYTVSTLALAALLMSGGGLRLENAWLSLLALVPAFAGMIVGQYVLKRARPEIFRLCFFFGMLALGGHLALFSG